MKAPRYLSYFISILIATLIGAFSGIATAVQTGPLTGIVMAFGQELQQVDDQDPNSPPDCKKYPKDRRCTVKK